MPSSCRVELARTSLLKRDARIERRFLGCHVHQFEVAVPGRAKFVISPTAETHLDRAQLAADAAQIAPVQRVTVGYQGLEIIGLRECVIESGIKPRCLHVPLLRSLLKSPLSLIPPL